MRTDELDQLLKILSDWADVPGVTIYLFGSRARSDHHANSDVDVHVRFAAGLDRATTAWWIAENDMDFESLRRSLPGRLEILDESDPLKDAIESAPVLSANGNALAVDLLPKP